MPKSPKVKSFIYKTQKFQRIQRGIFLEKIFIIGRTVSKETTDIRPNSNEYVMNEREEHFNHYVDF